MKNFKNKLKELTKTWNASGEFDGTEFEGRYFISDTDLDAFAAEHGFVDDEGCFIQTEIERNCDCTLIYNYSGANPNRLFGDQEVIFN